MKIPVDKLTRAFKMGASVKKDSDTPVRVSVYLDSSASRFLAETVRDALCRRRPRALCAICVVGEGFNSLYQYLGNDKELAGLYTTLSLILLSIILTGLNIYQKLGQFGGAGSIVPITGFANSVVSPAIEFQAEGQVFGIGCKIFTIAGPVILYGIFCSWVVGVIYWLGSIM